MVLNEKSLLELLSNNDVTFFIPPYQRNYEWEKEQCEVFLNDIIRVTNNNREARESKHFFGTVTFFQTNTAFGQPKKLVLIDGQQRVTTTMLFLVALWDLITDDRLKQFIESKYLKNDNVSDDSEYKIKLKQVETDWKAYCDIILGNHFDKSKNSAIYHNYAYFKNELGKIEENADFTLTDVIELGLNKFSVVTVELQPDSNPWENPQEIFESMNSLGKPLTLADLVRNYLLLGIEPKEQEFLYKNYWLHMEESIPHQVSSFIRDYIQLKEKKSFKQATERNYKELYSNFKKIFRNYDAKILLKTLSEYSDYYAYILLLEKTGSKEVDKRLGDIKILDVTTAYSFLMALIRSWKKNEITEKMLCDILDVFIIYITRRKIIGVVLAENKNFPTLVKKVPQLVKAQDKKKEMFKILSSMENHLRLPNDIEMERELSVMNFYGLKLCKFILSLIEESITKSRPDKDDEKLQIEHIMPRKLNESWKKELGEDYENIHQSLLNTIGNLTLIRHNQELGNKSFSEKKEIYENKAGLQIAKSEIIKYEHWNRETIEKRSKWIINYLLQSVLPIPDDMRKTNNFVMKRNGLSFLELQLIGQTIDYTSDNSIHAKVVSDKEVEFEGKRWHLSPLTREIETRKGTVNASGLYKGSHYWEYDGIKLIDII